MSRPSPIQYRHDHADALFTPFGEVEIASDFGSLEREYAAIRKATGLLDCPHRGLIQLTGNDRLEFLQRLITNDCAALEPGRGTRALLLNSKGRIVSDMIVIQREQQTWLDVDIHTAEPVITALDQYLFADDVQIENVTDQMHCLALHGPTTMQLLTSISETDPIELEPFQMRDLGIDAVAATAYRHDETGEVGVPLWAPSGDIETIYGKLTALEESAGLRTIGWLAYNTARIEGGTPIFNVDFGTNSLPHETGIIHDLASFTKGCYVGQEIVARMESLGHPAKMLVGFHTGDDTEIVAGVPVYDNADADDAIGAVTSSTFSPLRGNTTIGLAMVKWGRHEPGTSLHVAAQSGRTGITTQAMDQLTP